MMDYNISMEEFSPSAEPLYEVSPALVAIFAICYGSISMLALFGNSLVFIIIVSNKRMQSVTNFLLANLASADILIAVAAVPFQFQAALLQRWVLFEFMCVVAPFVQVLSVNVSIFTLTVISIERYRALLYPFKTRITKSVAGYAIAVIWTLAIACATPMGAAMKVQRFEDPRAPGGYKPFCYPSEFATPLNDSKEAQHEAWSESTRIYNHYVMFLVAVQFIIPLTIISFAYMTIALHLWGSHGLGEGGTGSVRIKQRQKVIKMLIVVVLLFAFCWLPLQAYNVLTFAIPGINEYQFINVIWFCCNFLAMSNSCQNPFILGFCNEKFRRELRRKFRLCFCLQRTLSLRRPDANGTTPREDTDFVNGTRYTVSRVERIRQSGSGKRCANHALTPDDSPVHTNSARSDMKVPLSKADYYN